MPVRFVSLLQFLHDAGFDRREIGFAGKIGFDALDAVFGIGDLTFDVGVPLLQFDDLGIKFRFRFFCLFLNFPLRFFVFGFEIFKPRELAFFVLADLRHFYGDQLLIVRKVRREGVGALLLDRKQGPAACRFAFGLRRFLQFLCQRFDADFLGRQIRKIRHFVEMDLRALDVAVLIGAGVADFVGALLHFRKGGFKVRKHLQKHFRLVGVAGAHESAEVKGEFADNIVQKRLIAAHSAGVGDLQGGILAGAFDDQAVDFHADRGVLLAVVVVDV